MNGSAVVALSGGQDSTTCLYWAKQKFGGEIHAVSFDYGQRHRVELQLASKVARAAGARHSVLDVRAFAQLGAASLTNEFISNTGDAEAARNRVADEKGLPQSFVPGRNIVFLSLVAAYAVQRGITDIVTGVCEADDAGYPDCRADFVDAIEYAIRLGMATPNLFIHTPLMQRTKAETWELADELGVLDVIVNDTNTCYEGDRSQLHPWGTGCGVCPACMTRREGYEHWQESLRSQVQ